MKTVYNPTGYPLQFCEGPRDYDDTMISTIESIYDLPRAYIYSMITHMALMPYTDKRSIEIMWRTLRSLDCRHRKV